MERVGHGRSLRPEMNTTQHPPEAPLTRAEIERWAADTARWAADLGALDLLERAVAALTPDKP